MICRYRRIWRPALAEITGDGRPWTVLMISLLSMPWVDVVDAQVRVPELALDDDQRETFVGHFHGVCVSELMCRGPPSDVRCSGRVMQLLAGG
jgi:hypothetical protein